MRVLIVVAASTVLLAGCGGGAERVGAVPGEPYKFKALGAERLDLALSDGTIVGSQDGGRHWKTTFRP